MYKKILSFIFALILAASCVLTVNAANPTTIYKYIIENGEVTLTDVSTSKDTLNIPAEIEGLPVTGIKSELFFYLFRMGEFEAINIPASVTNIETPIIFDTASVKAFNVDENNPAYSSEGGVLFNKDMTEILAYPNEKEDKTYTLPEGVVKIADSAFKYADFQYIELPDSLEYIGDNAFYKCCYLEKLHLPKGVEHIGRDALLLNYELYEVTVDVNNKHFSSLDGVLFNKDKSAILYYPVSKVGTRYDIPDGVETVGYRAFQGASPLTCVTLPEGLKKIDERGFCGCSKITLLELPSTLEFIGFEAFLNCGMEYVVIPEGVKEISDNAFRVSDDIKTVVLPESVTRIGNEAFYYARSLSEINIPSGVVEIGREAFRGCASIDEITIPYSVTNIGENAFADCNENLTVYGFSGSAAEAAAKAYGYKFVALESNYTENIMGDVNLDSKLNVRDATLLQKHLANITNLNPTALELADFDANGKINIKDATAIQKKIAGLL